MCIRAGVTSFSMLPKINWDKLFVLNKCIKSFIVEKISQVYQKSLWYFSCSGEHRHSKYLFN